MRMKKRITAALGLAASLAAVTVFPAFAEWKYDENVGKWWWQEYDGTYPRSEAGDAGTPFAVSRYLDGNGDGIAERYYFDENGYLYTGTTLKSQFVEANQVSVDENGAECYDDGRHIIMKVLTNQLPAATGSSFVNQMYMNLMGRERSYVESVLGTALKMEEWDPGRVRYTYADGVKIVFGADRASYMMLPAKLIFHFEKDSYADREITSILNIPEGNFEQSEILGEIYLFWYMTEEGLDQYVSISDGDAFEEQDYILHPDDEISVGLYHYSG